jgi:hypothetical protein
VNDRLIRLVVAALALAALAETPAAAYVDPGFDAALYQALYALIFGGLAALVLTPWRAVTTFLRQRFGRGGDSKPTSQG